MKFLLGQPDPTICKENRKGIFMQFLPPTVHSAFNTTIKKVNDDDDDDNDNDNKNNNVLVY